MGWNEEMMVTSFLDMRLACPEEQMEGLRHQGWKILNMMKVGGERRYTMVLPERRASGRPQWELNAIEHFRDDLREAQEQEFRMVS